MVKGRSCLHGRPEPTPLFQFKGHQLRHIMIEGEPWFHATDVCNIVGLSVGGVAGSVTRYLQRLRTDERRVVGRGEQIASAIFEATFASKITFINESGLYKLIMRSDKPEAKAFQDWVTPRSCDGHSSEKSLINYQRKFSAPDALG